MKTTLRNSKSLILVICAPLIVQLVFIAILSIFFAQADATIMAESRAKALVSDANAITKLFYDAGVALGGYSVSKNILFSERYTKISRTIPEVLQQMGELTRNNPREQQVVKDTADITSAGIKILDEARVAIDNKQPDVGDTRSRSMYKEVRSLSDKLQKTLNSGFEIEHQIATHPTALNESRNSIIICLMADVVVSILLSAGLFLF